ncbi:MAG: AAA domain-containing protein [Candidatus Binatia bacterium]
MGDLILQVDDAEADRRRVVEMLRDQEQPKIDSVDDRVKLAAEIERLERQFEEYRQALFQVRDRYGLSYRSMLARIARTEREHSEVRPLQPLRHLLKDQNNETLQQLCQALKRSEELFWSADFPNNPWVNGKEALTGDRFELEEIVADLDLVLPAAGIIDAWAGQTGPAFEAMLGNLEAISEAGETLAKNWQSLQIRRLVKIECSEPQIMAIEDVSYAIAARATERLVERQRSFFWWLFPDYHRSSKYLRGFVASRNWIKLVEAGPVYYMIAHRARDAARCETTLTNLHKWLTEGTVNDLRTRLRNGERISDVVSALRKYLSFLPVLLQYMSTVRGLDELGHQVVKVLENNHGSSPKKWAEVVELSALLTWVGQAELDSAILRRLTPQLYETDRARLSEVAKRKQHLDSDAIKTLWSTKWSSVDHRWRQGLRIRGPNSRRLREVVGTGRSRGLLSLRPCWLANPGTVSQIFPLEPKLFDLVIFDEASQCPPEYGLPTLFRAGRTVVAGDGKQLPPTMFFKSAFDFDLDESESRPSNGEQDEENIDLEISTGAEDLLSLAQARLPDSHLNVHYRSLDPALIAFSNAAFYQNRLETPQPAKHSTPNGEPALFLESVNGVYLNTRTNPSEASAVLDYLRSIWEMPTQPPTIGVVTFNDAQRETIEDLLDLEAEHNPEFRMIYEREITRTDEGQDVGFFVKSLEAVQGDERDVILFSTTYGRREDGRFMKSFLGPINRQGGERRLNVAITRAKLWVRIFTSLPIHELASALTPGAIETQDAAGRAMLQLYLAYAQHITKGELSAAENILRRAMEVAGGLSEHRGPLGGEDSEFEVEVREALRGALQVEIDTQVSSGSFRIDLAIRSPRDASYILGIECDGKAYHSAPSARAYDWWRQIILEKRGWQIHRVWSTSWRANREREIEKVRERLGHILREGRARNSS